MSDAAKTRWPFTRGQTTLIVLMLLAFALLAMYVSWNGSAERMLQAEIDAAHARGEFILLEDFPRVAPVPDEQNGAIYWKRAAAAAELTPEQDVRERDLVELGEFPPTPEELTFLRDVLKDRDEVWRNVQRTRGLDAVDWQVGPTAFILQQRVPVLNDVRHLANMLSHHALVSHVDGNDAAAIADVRDLLRESRDVESIVPALVTHLVSIGISAVAAATIERIAPDLQIGAGTGVGVNAASPDEVRKLIDELLDESSLPIGFHTAMQAERAMTIHYCKMVTGKPVIGTVQKIALARTLKWQAKLDEAVYLQNYPAVQRFLTANPAPPRNVYKYVPSMPSMVASSLVRTLDTSFRIRIDRRLAATALAIRWYQCDHNGKLPVRLDELVPKYVPAVPIDPLASDGRAIGYRPDERLPLIYSVGFDSTDDGGSVELKGKPRARRGHNIDRWDQKDVVMYLVRVPRENPKPENRSPNE